MESAIKIKNLRVTLGKGFTALDGITIDIPSDKVIGLIGPSGAGKTTLIRCIVGRQRFASGTISVFGVPAGDKRLRESVSYMTQEISVYNDLTVTENISYFATMAGPKHSAIKPEVSRLLEVVDLSKQAQQVVASLSGGQKQRVSLAIALIGKPKLLVLDEPTVGLDPLLRDQLWMLFRKLAGSGTALIISSHAMDEAERCDELLLIRDGAVLAQGSPRSLCERTRSATVEQSFLKLIGEKE